MTTRKVPENPWGFQTYAKCAVPVKKGEVLLAVFWARSGGCTSEEAEGEILFSSLRAPPYTKSSSVSLRVRQGVGEILCALCRGDGLRG